ncbi:MAG: cytochrome c [Gemmataceae bacterium]|nr:cytochrome c [Gemmataceae bacterium]
MTFPRSFTPLVLLGGLSLSQSGHAQQAARVVPKLEPVAETKLLMEGLAHANFKGLERLLTQKPGDNQAWTFARGQALLVAETANLLMLRPPQKEGQAVWFEKAMALRGRAADLANTLAKKDFDQARVGLSLVADSCNRCHQSFRVPVQIEPFAEN